MTGATTTSGLVVLSRPADAGAPGGARAAPTITSHEFKTPMTWTLRPISSSDETALIEFHDRCSEETHYLRFAAAKPQLRPAEAHYLCAVDDHSRGALVIVESDDPGTIHGVGRWERVNPTDAELAFVIEDAYQGQGFGRKLVEATAERAHEEGFSRLVTDVLSSNYRMRRLARDYNLVAADL
ncbi:MAG: GNAT family N-acetyltransferase [Solirubrobacterales bacterium]|nr:GNAT family N-acetyltransferase [Solirubrobacterales bacterium]